MYSHFFRRQKKSDVANLQLLLSSQLYSVLSRRIFSAFTGFRDIFVLFIRQDTLVSKAFVVNGNDLLPRHPLSDANIFPF